MWLLKRSYGVSTSSVPNTLSFNHMKIENKTAVRIIFFIVEHLRYGRMRI